MKRMLFFLLVIHLAPAFSRGQSNLNSMISYSMRAKALLASLDQDQLKIYHFPFDDTLREKWERLPGTRQGLKISALTERQKILLHELMRTCLSTQGYLTVTAVMFNEDIQKKFEPNLGRNEFWTELFGDPGPDANWGWKLEGHHLSLNFTFTGDRMISNSPFLMASNPSNSITDSARAGLIILYKEEEIARTLVNSLSPEQLKLAYTSEKRPEIVYGEQDKARLRIPDPGIRYDQLNHDQQHLVRELAAEYFNNFNPGEIGPVDAFCQGDLKFFYMDGREKGKPHYYRLMRGNQVIEYENYDNHIHCFWRTTNDFGKEMIKKK